MYKINLNWDDREAIPDKIRPDVEYLFSRMNEAVIDMVDARQGDRILDVGCGRGIEVLKMSEQGAVVIGIDPSSFMLDRARELSRNNGHNSSLVRAIGESIPIVPQSVDKILCKGALDHFADPEKAIQQMATVLKPQGQVVIAIANFESLGFRIGKFIFKVRKLLGIKNPYSRLPWELPNDHTMKFDYSSITNIARRYLVIDKVTGVSLLFCTPGWGDALSRLPARLSRAVLSTLDGIARAWVGMSDVVIVRARPLNGLREN
jgi:SAM-dependent methyltransferase